MQPPPEPNEFGEKLKKRNRLQKLLPKTHRIVTEHSRGLKNLWQKIIEKSKSGKI